MRKKRKKRKPYTPVMRQCIINGRYIGRTWKMVARDISSLRGEKVKPESIRFVIYAYWFKDGLAALTERREMQHAWATYERGIRKYIQTESGAIDFALHRESIGEQPRPVAKVNYESLEALEARLKALKAARKIRDFQIRKHHRHIDGHRAEVAIAML